MISKMFVIERQSLPAQACANDNNTSSHICAQRLRVLRRLCKWFSMLTRLIMSPNSTVIMVITMFPAKCSVIHSQKIGESHVKNISIFIEIPWF